MYSRLGLTMFFAAVAGGCQANLIGICDGAPCAIDGGPGMAPPGDPDGGAPGAPMAGPGDGGGPGPGMAMDARPPLMPPGGMGAPPDGGMLPPPPPGMAPPDGGMYPPPPGGMLPPPDGGMYPPPPGGMLPPPDGGVYPPPPGGMLPPPDGGVYPPPPGGMLPPPDGGMYPPPPGGMGGAPGGMGGAPGGTGGAPGGTGGTGGSSGSACTEPSGTARETHVGAGHVSGVFFDGNHAAMSCGSFIVGTPNSATSGGAAAGAATVFTWSGTAWQTEQRLIASDGSTANLFGTGAAIDGDRVVVGASNKDSGMAGMTCSLPSCITAVGAAYVFSRSAGVWTQDQKLATSSEQSNGHFGQAVAISGNTIAVGSPYHYINIRNADGTITTQQRAGIVEVFTKGPLKWVLQEKLEASDALHYDTAGIALALSGNTLIVGAPGQSGGGVNGRVFVYDRSGTSWTRDAVVTADDGATGDFFGSAVAFSGTTLVVGASGDDDGGDASGSAYVFVGSGTSWTQQQKLVAPDAAASAGFGSSVAAVSADRVLVGAPGAGKIYSFTRSGTTWTEDAVYTACSGSPGQSLGVSGTLAVSAGEDSWVFDLADPDTSCVPN